MLVVPSLLKVTSRCVVVITGGDEDDQRKKGKEIGIKQGFHPGFASLWAKEVVSYTLLT